MATTGFSSIHEPVVGTRCAICRTAATNAEMGSHSPISRGMAAIPSIGTKVPARKASGNTITNPCIASELRTIIPSGTPNQVKANSPSRSSPARATVSDEAVCHVQHRLARHEYGFQRLAPAGRQFVAQNDLSHADSGVEGGAQIVAQVGQVLGLDRRRRLGLVACRDQLGACLGVDETVAYRPLERVGVQLGDDQAVGGARRQGLDIEIVVDIVDQHDERRSRPGGDGRGHDVETAPLTRVLVDQIDVVLVGGDGSAPAA